jgi:DNA-directed RNA polymerase specialized sigma24 family protein
MPAVSSETKPTRRRRATDVPVAGHIIDSPALALLDRRTRVVVRAKLAGLLLREIAAVLGLSLQQVANIYRSAERKLEPVGVRLPKISRGGYVIEEVDVE